MANALFPLLIVVLHFVQFDHYHPLRQAVSELALGRAGWLMAIAFCSSGIGSLLIALVLKRTAAHPRLAPALLTTAGLLSFLSAFVHADSSSSNTTTTHGQIHQIAGVATFLLIIAAMFSLVRAFRRDQCWRPLATPTLAWAITSIACIFLIPISGSAYFGLAQRTLLATCFSWILTISLYAYHDDARRGANGRRATGHRSELVKEAVARSRGAWDISFSTSYLTELSADTNNDPRSPARRARLLRWATIRRGGV